MASTTETLTEGSSPSAIRVQPDRGVSDGVSVVVPVFGDGAALHELVARTNAVLTRLGTPWELLLVNDGSHAPCWSLIADLAARQREVRGIDLMRNYGQHNALLCGVRAARYEVVVTMDDDLQHPPEEVPSLLAKLHEGYDVAYGVPRELHHGWWRDLASQLTKLMMQSALGVDVARKVSGFRAFRTPLRNAFANYTGPFVSLDVLLTWGTKNVAGVTVRHDARRYGASNYTLGKLILHAMNMMTGFSVLPLRAASVLGLFVALFGLVVLAYVIGRLLIEGRSVPGFPFLASVIAIFSGAQLLVLGIIGEYLARIHFGMMDRPSYTVRATTFES